MFASRRFLPLFVTQFLGAFNDNLFKNAVVMLITYRLAGELGSHAPMLVALSTGVFILPYFLFSATAGQLADKYDRAKVARLTKLWELVIVCIAAAGFYFENAYFLMAVLFCLGIQAAFFGPVKYALLPQHLRENELVAGNGYIEAGTFLAILLGTIAGGLLVMQPGGQHWVALSMIGVGLAGYMASRFIPAAPSPTPGLRMRWNIIAETRSMLASDRRNTEVWRSILAISWFWLVGATFLAQFPAFAKQLLNADETVVTLFLAMFSLGIALGSAFCGKILKGKISDRLAPYALLGLSLFTFDFCYAGLHAMPNAGALIGFSDFISNPAHWRMLVDLLLIAVCGGFYIVPLYAMLQHHSDPAMRARTIASNNVVNAFFMVISALGTTFLYALGVSVGQLFLLVGALNLAVAGWLFRARRA